MFLLHTRWLKTLYSSQTSIEWSEKKNLAADIRFNIDYFIDSIDEGTWMPCFNAVSTSAFDKPLLCSSFI